MIVYFIVLHYINIQDTLNCIESIKQLDSEKKIIVVDNGSNNGTGEELVEKYSRDSDVTVILSNENLGFAKGNNLGIAKIEDKNTALVVVCNSDLIFHEDSFINQINSLYREKGYAVLGPDVVSEDMKKHENPTALEICDKKDLNRQIRFFRLLNYLNSKNMINISRFVHRIFRGTPKKYTNIEETDNSIEPIKVHGSCFILSPQYFEKYDGLFEGTFLFQEENILGNMCYKTGLKILYSPKASVIHLGSKSYKVKYSNVGNRFKKYVKYNLESLKSYGVFLSEKGMEKSK